MISHGNFRYGFGGDLHGRPSDGPDVESHLAQVSAPFFYGPLGLDIVHAHHHARRTASNATFAGAAAPADGRSRNVVAGINEAYYGSPYQEVLDEWTVDDRLEQGHVWVTALTLGGGSSDAMINAQGRVIIRTVGGGAGYRIQAAGTALQSQAYPSVRYTGP